MSFILCSYSASLEFKLEFEFIDETGEVEEAVFVVDEVIYEPMTDPC